MIANNNVSNAHNAQFKTWSIHWLKHNMKAVLIALFKKQTYHLQWRFYSLKVELMIIFLNCSLLVRYTVGYLNRNTMIENPLNTPLLDLKGTSSLDICVYFVIWFTKSSYDNKNANLNDLSYLPLTTDNSM